jgi:hypothetical protein
MEVIEPDLLDVAEAQCVNRLQAEDFENRKTELFDHLKLQIPPVIVSDAPSSPWLAICASWLYEITSLGGSSLSALPLIANDSRLNRFVLKTIELSAVAGLWSGDEPVAT